MVRAAALGGVVATVVGLGAGPASAHAVLLGTDPRPQATVDRPPAAVELEFSEPVEAAFGAIRLYDVDGRRLDAARIVRNRDGRQLSLPLGDLPDGTYTVTWRVASTDGHAVTGGFGFYVGAPSAISAVAVDPDGGAGPVVAWGYGVLRFTWFGALMALVGLVATRRFVWTPAVTAAGLRGSDAASVFRHRFARALAAAWVVLALTGAAAIVFQGATLSGSGLRDAARPSVVSAVLDTAFGRLWVVQILVTLAAAVPVTALARSKKLLGVRPAGWIPVLGTAAFGLCLVTAAAGHARTGDRPALGVASVAVHLLAASVWVGGLGTLVALGGAAWRRLGPEERRRLLAQLLPRFGRLAIAAVAVVVATGTLNSLSGLAAVSDLWRVPYGRVLAAKIVLLAAALAFAVRHRYLLPRRLGGEDGGDPGTVASFRRSAAAELTVLVISVSLAAALVGLAPGRSLALAERGPVTREEPAGGYVAQLLVDPGATGGNEVHVTFVDDAGMGAAEVSAVSAGLGPDPGTAAPLAMRLIAPGHFVGDARFPEAGRYRLSVTTAQGASATFRFPVRRAGRR